MAKASQAGPGSSTEKPVSNQPGPRGETTRKRYGAPALTRHGAIAVHTAADFSSSIDSSDRALKTSVAPVDGARVLAGVAALPISTWSYRGEQVRHLGPMAQDFSATFGLGADDRHIHTVDASGVALAAIQELHGIVRAQAARLAALEQELSVLRRNEGR